MSQIALKEIAALLMLIPFGVVLGIGLFFVYCALRRSRMERAADGFARQCFDFSNRPLATGFRSSILARPTRWLAIKGEDWTAVQAALRLHHATPCSWEEGLVEAKEDKLFISPAISGWILVMGSALPDPSDDVDKFFHFISRLSQKLGQVQYYNANPVVNHHAWILTESGRIYRAYAWGDGVLWNEGPITAAEKDLGLRSFDYGSELDHFTTDGLLAANCEKVGRLAARWSVDPNAISQENWDANGIVGEMS